MNWRETWNHKKHYLIILFVLLLITLVAVFLVLTYVENREGISMYDPILSLFQAVDVSAVLFFLTYSGSILGIVLCLKSPVQAIKASITYMILLWLRMICMLVTPLNPPEDIIPLRDYFLELTFYAGQANVKDLFFSGHTATMFMFYFLMEKKFLKNEQYEKLSEK